MWKRPKLKVGGPRGDEPADGPRCKAARFNIYDEAQHFVIGDESDDEVAANRKGTACKRECKRRCKDDQLPKHYRVRTKSKPAMLFCGRKGSKL